MSQLVLRSGYHSVQELLVGREEVAGGPCSPYTPLQNSSDSVSVDCTSESDEERWSETSAPGHVTGSNSSSPGHVTGSNSSPPVGSLAVGGVLKEVLPLLCEFLTRDSWKDHPSHKHSLAWCLRHLTHPHLGGQRLHLFLPPLLLFVDDYEVGKNRWAGHGRGILVTFITPVIALMRVLGPLSWSSTGGRGQRS